MTVYANTLRQSGALLNQENLNQAGQIGSGVKGSNLAKGE